MSKIYCFAYSFFVTKIYTWWKYSGPSELGNFLESCVLLCSAAFFSGYFTFLTRNTGTFTIRIRDQTHIKEASTRSEARYVPQSSTSTSVSPKGKEV